LTQKIKIGNSHTVRSADHLSIVAVFAAIRIAVTVLTLAKIGIRSKSCYSNVQNAVNF